MTKSKHFLAKRAYIYPVPDEATIIPADCEFDDVLGAWRWIRAGDLLVRSAASDRPRPQTKKFDRETGEDQKGE